MADLTLEVALSHKAPHQTGHSRLEKKTQKFDEAKHPREPGGTAEGGQFTETGHAGEATPHPALARQAKEGIAAVEKLIPEAIRTAEIPKEDLDGVSWATVDQATRTEVEQKHREFALKEWNWTPGAEMPAKLAAIQDVWGGLSEQDKTNLMNNYVISGQITRRGLTAKEPTEWVTGVTDNDEDSRENYARTHAIALRLTELRTEQLREERGLFEEDQGENYQPRKIVSTEFLIEDVWNAWKQKSSERLGLSLQLAAALEFDGFHRMSPEEVMEAEDQASKVGGIDTLRAYVRAQWEVTQTIMAKAHEDKVDVYRAIMLPGEKVEETTHTYVRSQGEAIPPPEQVRTYDKDLMVDFYFEGQKFTVAKEVIMAKSPAMAIPKEFGEAEARIETTDEAVQRRIRAYLTEIPRIYDIYTKLPDLKLHRAGAQSTTGTRQVANDWSGVGDLPDNPARVVLRIEAPSTSVLSLPVYGKNIQEEHESVLMGTRDKWLWDAWLDRAPNMDGLSVGSQGRVRKAEFLVIDLQAEDRNRPHWMSTVNWSALQSVAKFDEAKHPREPGGSSEGGQFTESGHVGVVTSDPALAEQAKVGISTVEKLVQEAIDTADYEDVPEHQPDSWSDVSDAIQGKVYDKWYEDAVNNSSGDVDTTELDREIRKEVQDDNQDILNRAEKDTLEELDTNNPFQDLAPTLPVEGEEGFNLQRVIDPETFNYVDGEHDPDGGTVELDLEALRFKSGEPLTLEEQRVVQTRWDDNYRQAYDKALEKAYESESYYERRNELEQQGIDDEWSNMSNSEKLTLASEYGLVSSSVEPGRPDNWVTGIEKGDAGDEDYGRTHAVALRLTELRMEEIRKERGLLGPGDKPTFTIHKAVDYTEERPNYVAKDVNGKVIANSSTLKQVALNADQWASDESERISRVRSDTLIRRVWTEWKQSSSESLGLSLQLAAARELGGVHRMTPKEIEDAEWAAESQGGMKMLQAYVRAQWEVTQYVMDKAGENHLEVYRGLMLAGDRVAETAHQRMDQYGKPLAPPTNVVEGHYDSSPAGPQGKPIVSFDFNGEHFVVERKKTPPKSILDIPTDNWTDAQREEYEKTHPLESVETAIQRRLDDYLKGRQTDILTKLPDLPLRRAGAQSTTGTPSVANEWGGVGNLPPNPVRVVLRIDAPSTSVLSLPVYGSNTQGEHESVLAGTKDKWLWDAWQNAAPTFRSMPMTSHARKADTKPLVIDLQEEDRGKPHWLSGLQSIAPKPPVPPVPPPFKTVLKWDRNQPRGPKGTHQGGRWVKDVSQGIVAPEDSNEAWATVPGMERGGGGASFAAIMNAPMGTGFKNPPRGEKDLRVNVMLARAAAADEALQARAEAGAPQSKLLDVLESADVVSSKELNPGEHVNTVLKVKLNDANGTKAVFKPEAGEGWTGTFANSDINEYVTNRDFSLAERERTSFEVSEALGLGLVPAVAHRTELGGVDLGNLSSGDSGYDSYDIREQYDAYKERADEAAIDQVGEEMSNLFNEHVDDIGKRADEVTEIWNRLVEEYPDHAADRAHPALPMGSQPGFERKVPQEVDPYEILKEADVDVSAALNKEEKEKIEAALRQRLEAGAEELGDIDRNEVYDQEYDNWRQEHEDTENRLYQSKVQSFDSWKQSQGYGSGGGGGGGAKNAEAPNPRGGSLQVFVEGLEDSGYPTDEEVRKLAVFDYLVGTMDRHPANVSFDGDGKLLAMDNGYSFPDVNVADGFIFRSAPIRLWKKHKGQAQLMPEADREKIARALEQTDWKALVARHPMMTPGERNAFLGRVEYMKEAMKTETGLRDLWSRLSVMN